MDEILTLICAVISMIASVVLFVFIVSTVLPRTVIKRRYFLGDRLGRGMKKYVSDGARAIVYEPAPSVRKYIKRFALIKSGGQKYFKCLVDEYVKTMEYSIVMLDNKHRVIDVLSVDEAPNGSAECGPVFIHRSTSYVALTVRSVNGRALEITGTSYYLLRDVCIFSFLVAALSFAESMAISELLAIASSAVSGISPSISFNFVTLAGTAVLIGVLSAVILLLHCSKKNVRVLLND